MSALRADFMHRPGDGGAGQAFAVLVELRGAPDHVMEDVAPADGLATGTDLVVDVVDFNDFHRFDPTVFGQPGRRRFDFAPPGPECLPAW